LRKDFFLQRRRVSHESIKGGHTSNWSVQMIEKLCRYAGGYFRSISPRLSIFVNDQRLVGLLYRFSYSGPVIRIKASQIHHFDAYTVVLFDLFRGDNGALNGCAIGDYGNIVPRTYDPGLPERDHVIRPGIRSLVMSLPIQMLMLEKQYWIVASD